MLLHDEFLLNYFLKSFFLYSFIIFILEAVATTKIIGGGVGGGRKNPQNQTMWKYFVRR